MQFYFPINIYTNSCWFYSCSSPFYICLLVDYLNWGLSPISRELLTDFRELLVLTACWYVSYHEIVSCIMWFPRFLIALVGLIVYSNRTKLAQVHYDVHRDVVPHLCPHFYPRFPMHVLMYNHRVLYRRMVSLSQLSLILLYGDVTVYPGLLRLGFANCRSLRNKGHY